MPARIKKILLATDFSDCAALAQEHAVFLAKASGAGLDVVHVIELYPGLDPEYPVNHLYLEHVRKETTRELGAAVNQIVLNGVVVKSHQIIGMPSRKISELAKMLGTDLIVMGTHGRTGLDHVLLGSTAERVVTSAPCPVMTIRLEKRDEQHSSPISLRGILAPIDFSDCSLEAFDYGVRVAKQFGASLTILHVLEPVSYGLDFTLCHTAERESLKERTESRLAGLVEIVKSEGVPAHSEVRGGIPADTIVRAAHDSSYDLIIMGTHGRRGLSHVVSGSVAEAVLRRASCPVLMVKRQRRIPHHPQFLIGGEKDHEKGSAWRTTESISTRRTTIDGEETQGDEPDRTPRRNPGRSA